MLEASGSTSAEVEKTLTTVKTKKKTLEKLQKQLDKIEDVSVALETNRKLLQASRSHIPAFSASHSTPSPFSPSFTFLRVQHVESES